MEFADLETLLSAIIQATGMTEKKLGQKTIHKMEKIFLPEIVERDKIT